MSENSKPSNAYYLLPILLGILGGIIMYVKLRNKDPKMAVRGLIWGIILSVVSFAIWPALMMMDWLLM